MQVGPAQAAGADLDQDLVRSWSRLRDLLSPKGLPLAVQDHRLHAAPILAPAQTRALRPDAVTHNLRVVELKQAKLLQGLPDHEVRSLEKQVKFVEHPAGHQIVVRGEGGVGFMIITDGNVTVKTGQGKTRRLGPGDSFGEMALLDQEGRSATVTADTAVTLATIPEWNFKPFLKEHPEVAYRLLQVLSRRVRQAEGDL